MVMRAFNKTIKRTFRRNITRLFSITAIIALGICFVTGIGALAPKIVDSYKVSLKEQKIADIIVKSKSTTGFDQGLIDEINSLGSIESSIAITAIESEINDISQRLYALDIEAIPFNQLVLEEGTYPSSYGECVVEKASDTIAKIEIDETIESLGQSFKVTGIVSNPLFFLKNGEDDLINQEPLDQIIYINKATFPIPLPITDLYLRVDNAQKEHELFSKKYRQEIDKVVTEIKEIDSNLEVLTLEENKSTAFLIDITDKIRVISYIIPVFFILVVGLVVLTTMSRMIEEERGIIGCYQTLGYSNGKISFKYLLFSFVCFFVGMAVGLVTGAYILPAIICPVFSASFFLPNLVISADVLLGVISSLAMLAGIAFVTIYVLRKELRRSPSNLLRPKAPKPGKKITLEKISFIWKRLPFKYKSTCRNIFRYVGRFWMVVVSISGSTALVMAGFGLSDISKSEEGITGILRSVQDTIGAVSGVIIIFAVALTILVIYNLTNMSISERKREMATLKVLGYHNYEVGGYIFREILLMSLMGILIGIPLGILLLSFVFQYLDFGAIADIQWTSYIWTVLITLVAICIVDLLLFPKIIKEDMNESLKSVE